MFEHVFGRRTAAASRVAPSALAIVALLAMTLLPVGIASAASPMSISDSDSPDPVMSGNHITYTIAMANTGGAKVSSVVMTDQLNGVVGFGNPPLLTMTSSRGSCTQNNTQVTCTTATIEGGGTWTVTIEGVVTAAAGTVINNTATVTGTKSAQTFSNSASATTQVNGTSNGGLSPDLTIGKNGPLSAASGGPLTYTLTVNNIGTSNATGVKVVDTMPTGITSIAAAGTSLFACSVSSPTVTCTGGQVNAGANATITITGTAPTVTSNTVLTNTSVVDPDNTIDEGILGSTTDPAELNNTSNTVTTTVSPIPPPPPGPITMTKVRFDPSAPTDTTKFNNPIAVPGDTIYYRLTVTNGTKGRADYITVTDATQGLQAASITVTKATSTSGTTPSCAVSAPTVTCTMTRLAVSGTMTVELKGLVVASAGSTILNTASVNANIVNTGYTATDQVQTTIRPGYDFTITKADSPDPVCASSWPGATTGVCRSTPTPSTTKPFGGLTYTFVVSNSGVLDANDVVVRDPLPAGVTYDSAVTPSGWSCASDASNVVTCHGPIGHGPSANVTFSILAAAPSATGKITNTVTVDPNNAIFEADETNNSATQTTTVVTGVDLIVSKVAKFSPVATSGTETWTVTVDNIGTQDVTGIRVRDTLPAGTTFRTASADHGFTCSNLGGGVIECVGGSLLGTKSESYSNPPSFSPQGDDKATITIVAFAQPIVGTMHNEVRVDPLNEIAEADESNNLYTLNTDTVYGNADKSAFNQLEISKKVFSPASGPVATNGTLTYKIVVGNDGTDDAINVGVRDFLPAGSRFISATGDAQFNCVQSNGIVDCTGGVIAKNTPLGTGGGATITVVVFAPNTPGTFTNQAIVDPGNLIPEGNETDNTASATVQVATVGNGGQNAFNELSITKSGAPEPVSTSSLETYTIKVTNTGTDPAFQVRVRDFLPTGFTYIQAADAAPGPDAFFCSIGAANVLDCFGATVNAGATRTITVSTFASAVPGSYTNLAQVDPDNTIPEGDETNDSAQWTTHVTVGAGYIDLQVTKCDQPPVAPSDPQGCTVPSDPVTPGANIIYVIRASNAGTNPAFNVVVRDVMPAGTTFVSAGDVTGGDGAFTCSPSGGNIDCTGGVLDGSADLLSTVPTSRDIQVVLKAPVVTGVTIQNQASIDPANTIPESNELNNTATQGTLVQSQINLKVTKTGPTTATQSQTATYDITVTNDGTDPALGVQVHDPLPVGMIPLAAYTDSPDQNNFACQVQQNPVNVVDCLGDLDGTVDHLATLTNTVVIHVQVFITATDGTKLDNEACVDPSNKILESNELDNCSTASTVVGIPDLAISKSASSTSVNQGDQVTYTLTVSNQGDAVTTGGVKVTDTLDAGLTFVNASGTNQFTCAFSAPNLTCSGPDLQPGASSVITLVTTVNTSNGPIPNKGHVDQVSGETNLANNDSTVNVSVGTVGTDLVLINQHEQPDPVPQGDTTTYTYLVTNNGATTTPTFDITQTFASLSNVTPVSVTASQGFSCTGPTSNVYTCTGSLAGGASTTVKVVIQTTGLSPSSLSSTIVADAGNTVTETNEGNNSATEVTTVSPALCSSCVDLKLTQPSAAPAGNINNGDTVKFVSAVGNIGDTSTDSTPNPDVDIVWTVTGDFSGAQYTATNGLTCSVTLHTAGVEDIVECTGELGPGQGTVLTAQVTAASGSQDITAGATAYLFGTKTDANLANNGPLSVTTHVN